MSLARNTNMKSTICFAIIVVFAAFLHTSVDAALLQEIVEPHPDYPGKCYDAETKKAYNVGERWQATNGCARYECSTHDNKFLITGATCGVVGASPPCFVVDGPKDAPYPECCYKVECPKTT
ncbi:hypothetical protein L9F63_014416 [Diploptera punctata]|uniref:Single domain-containing protein n=1 Tax=Diploptera punctata TaxID=6984 RepID=A0AAD8EKN7_DIPPU|nr:hypothetical protein L9F63_014416 [Diploptera punctata]